MAIAVIAATWRFGQEAVEVGWRVLTEGGTALDAVVEGATAVERNPETTSVGWGSQPNAEGLLELDAAVMDGVGHRCGAVAAVTGFRSVTAIARRVMEATPHVLLVGWNARRFALQQGFEQEETSTPESRLRYRQWRLERTAPDVAHFEERRPRAWSEADPQDAHDTVGVVALDSSGNLAGACATSGLAWKLPGRVGDSPIIGSGLYVDNEVGAAVATGNGDEIMKACLTSRAIFLMERGLDVQQACEEAIRYLIRKRPDHQSRGAALLAIDRRGQIGQAATREGFYAPDRLWLYSYTVSGQAELKEGTYVSSPTPNA